MASVLVSWIGHADLKAPSDSDEIGLGPLAQALTWRTFDEAALLSDHAEETSRTYLTWLSGLTPTKLYPYYEPLFGPTHFGEIYEAVVRVVSDVIRRHGPTTELTFHLSPGTPAMAAVWIILAKTRFPAELIESSKEHGVRTASVPFDISAEFIPDLLRKPDRELERLSAGLPPEAPEFDEIIHRSAIMKRVIAQARLVAARSIPVLIEGESGTGKELLARAIHRASPRRDKPFVAVNCGAIPSELLEAELFGYAKGAFTGAVRSHAGYFEKSSTGTLFLDEIGELPPAAQVKILRVLQEKQVTQVGSTTPVAIDLRLLAATNRKLIEEVANGHFRNDLFYRIAVAVLQLPPLRDRPGDIGLLIDRLFNQINEESTNEPGFSRKKISASARNLLLQHSWPGNVRELYSTLLRAAIWSSGTTISSNDIATAILPTSTAKTTEVLNRPLGEGLNLPEIISRVARHYLSRALEEARGNKTKAAELVGLPSYQTLSNWLNKYGVMR